MGISTAEQAIDHLKNLDRAIRKHIPRTGRDRGGFDHTIRRLTMEEWGLIEELVKKFDFPCILLPWSYGFLLDIHSNIKSKEQLERLIRIQDGQFPFPSALDGFAGQEKTLDQLSSLVYRDRNKKLLKLYGFEDLKPSIHSYAY